MEEKLILNTEIDKGLTAASKEKIRELAASMSVEPFRIERYIYNSKRKPSASSDRLPQKKRCGFDEFKALQKRGVDEERASFFKRIAHEWKGVDELTKLEMNRMAEKKNSLPFFGLEDDKIANGLFKQLTLLVKKFNSANIKCIAATLHFDPLSRVNIFCTKDAEHLKSDIQDIMCKDPLQSCTRSVRMRQIVMEIFQERWEQCMKINTKVPYLSSDLIVTGLPTGIDFKHPQMYTEKELHKIISVEKNQIQMSIAMKTKDLDGILNTLENLKLISRTLRSRILIEDRSNGQEGIAIQGEEIHIANFDQSVETLFLGQESAAGMDINDLEESKIETVMPSSVASTSKQVQDHEAINIIKEAGQSEIQCIIGSNYVPDTPKEDCAVKLSSRKGKRYTTEEKTQILTLTETIGIKRTSEQCNVAESTIFKWKKNKYN